MILDSIATKEKCLSAASLDDDERFVVGVISHAVMDLDLLDNVLADLAG